MRPRRHAAFGADLYEVLAADDAETGLLAVQRGRRAAAGLVRCAWPDRGGTGPGPAPGRPGQNVADTGEAAGPVAREPGSAVFRAPNTAWLQAGLRAARVHRPAQPPGRGHARQRGFRRRARAGAGRDQHRDRRADRGQDHRAAAARLGHRADQAGARQRGVPEGGVGRPLRRGRDGRRAVLPPGPGRPGVAVPVMHGTAPRDYLRGDGYQAVLLPYRDIGLAMAVLLPDGPLAALRPKVAAAGFGPAGRGGPAPGHAGPAPVPAGDGDRPDPGAAAAGRGPGVRRRG